MKRKIASIILCAAMLLSCAAALSSCGGDSTPAVMTLDGKTVTAAMYHYWASEAKGSYISSYDDVKNTDEYWASEITDGKSAAEYFDEMTLDSIKTNLCAMKLFDDYGLSLSSSEKSKISDYLSDLVKEYADGSRSTMNTFLGEYGVNLKILETIYRDEAKLSKVYDCLYGDGGTEAPTNDELEQYYNDFYVHFQLIYINNAYQYVKDSDGNMVTDDDGYYKTEDMNASDKAKKDAAIAEVKGALDAGGDFDSLYEEYSEFKDYTNGFYYSASQQYSDLLYYKLISSVTAVGEGEIATLETDTGTYIMKRLPLDAGAWSKSENSDFFPESGDNTYRSSVANYKFRQKLTAMYDDITVDEDAIAEYSVTKVTPYYSAY